MIGVVLVTHGRLAEEFLYALEHVIGKQYQMEAIGVDPDDDMEIAKKKIYDAVQRVDDGTGVIVLTDMFGGTPSNLAISLIEKMQIEVLSGVNLPMLIKLASIRDQLDLKEAIDKTKNAGKKYINIASELLKDV